MWLQLVALGGVYCFANCAHQKTPFMHIIETKCTMMYSIHITALEVLLCVDASTMTCISEVHMNPTQL